MRTRTSPWSAAGSLPGRMPKAWNRAVLLILIVLCGAAAARAQTSTWTGGAGNWEPCPSQNGDALWDTCSDGNYPDGPTDNAVIDGGPVTVNYGVSVANLTVASGDSLMIGPGYVDIAGSGAITNNGSISIAPGDGLGLTGQGATVVLSGSGTVSLTASNSFFGGTPGTPPTLVNQQTITGLGSLGGEVMNLTNQGTFQASGGMLSVHTAAAGIVNTGTMEADAASTLWVIGPTANKGGTIKALNGGTVTLDGNVTGGTLTTSGSGVIQLTQASILKNVTNNGLVQVSDNAGIVQGAIQNYGTIQVKSAGTLFFTGNVTLTGTGSLLLSDTSDLEENSSTAAPSGGSLTNLSLIHGGGTIYELPFTNEATITADNKMYPLTLEGSTARNPGLLRASGGATLNIASSETVENTEGLIRAEAGSKVALSGTVSGGTLATLGTGVIESDNGTLDGTRDAVNIGGKLALAENLTLEGTINNGGTITMGEDSCIDLAEPTTLIGSGTMILSENTCIYGSGVPLTNKSTIEGAGLIGDSNPMPITNDGTIYANASTPLTITPDAGGFSNQGELAIAEGSTMIIDTLGGPFKNLSKGVLTGGLYNLVGQLQIGEAITANAAEITLAGPAQIYNTYTDADAMAGLALNEKKGTLAIEAGKTFTTSAQKFTNEGNVTVGELSRFVIDGAYTQDDGVTAVDGSLEVGNATGKEQPKALTLVAGTLEGAGSISAHITSTGAVTAGDSTDAPGTLKVTGSYTQDGTGTLNISFDATAHSELEVTGNAKLNGTLNIVLPKAFTPPAGKKYTILEASGGVTGHFSKSTGIKIDSTKHFEIEYSPDDVKLVVESGP